MKKRSLLNGIWILALVLFPLSLFGQCPAFDFSLPTTVCINENFIVDNLSASAGTETVSWDLCSGDLLNSVTGSELTTLTNISAPRATTTARQGQDVFSFIVGENNRLIRVRSIGGLAGSTEITNFQNIGNLLVTPRGIAYVKEAGNHYLIIVNLSGSLVRVSFGSDLTSTPSAALMSGVPSMASASALEFLDTGSSKILYGIGVGSGNRQLQILDFGTSISNIPTSVSYNFPNASGLSGLSLIRNCDDWYGLMTSFSNNKYYKLFFGSNPKSLQSSQELTGITGPLGAELRLELGQYLGFISTQAGDLYRLSFGSDFGSSATPSSTNLGTLGVLSQTRAFDIEQEGSRYYGIGVGYTDKKLVRITFEEHCGASTSVTSALTSPSLAYENSGTYYITGEVTDSDGSIYRLSKQIIVSSLTAPAIDIQYENMCVGHDVNFSLTSSVALAQYQWSFGDGAESSEAQPVHQFQTAGQYDVEVAVVGVNGCLNNDTKSVSLYNAPVGEFSVPSGVLCTNTSLTFENPNADDVNGNLETTWYLNNEIIDNTFDLQHIFTSSEVSYLKLKVSIPGCSAESTMTLDNLQGGPLGSFTAEPTCGNEIIKLTNTSEGDIAENTWWIAGVAYTDGNPQITLPDGNHQITLEVAGVNGCVTTVIHDIDIIPAPVAEYVLEGSGLFCEETDLQFIDFTEPGQAEIVDWNWNFGLFSSSEKNPIVSFDEPGSYSVKLKVTDGNGCKDDVAYSINVVAKPKPVVSHGNLCISSPVNFSATGNAVSKWSWQIADKTYNTWNPVHTFRSSGDFPVTLTATGSNGCVTVTQETVHIYPEVIPAFTSSNNCPDMPALLTDASVSEDEIVSWEWTVDGEEFSTSSVTHTFSEAGLYPVDLMIITASGCNYLSMEDIEVVEAPVAAFHVSSEIGAPDVPFIFTNTSSNATIFTWDFGDGNTSDTNSPEYRYASLGNYPVKLTAANEQGCTAIATRTLQVKAPAPDARIISIEASEGQNNTILLNLIIQNGGNTVFENLRINVDISGAIVLTETIPDRIVPNSRYNLSLNYGILQNKSLQFICADAVLDEDINASDNKNCVNVNAEGPKLLPVYPNPAKGQVAVEWMGGNGTETTITIVNSMGIEIFRQTVQNEEGLNTMAVDLSHAEGGIYMVVMECGSALTTHRFVLAH